MAPQTRSRNRPSTSGPASKPKSKPKPKSGPAKIYKSTPAAPKQVTFPERRRRIKTYSRNRKVRKDSQQSTLTQLGISIEGPSRELQESEKEDEGDDQAEEPDEPEEPEAPAPVEPVNPKKRTRASRRKTTGDELFVNEKPKNAKRRKTLGDPPTPSASSSFHTQTLTQIYAKQDNQKENEEDRLNVSEPEDDAGFVMETPKKSKDGSSSKIDEGNPEPQAEVKSSARSLVPSATPTNRKLEAVVASSVSTASTVSALSSPRINEFNPAPDDSPLRTRSTNLGAPSPIIKKVKTPRNQEIPNSYSTTHSLPNTPTPKAAKKTRFDDVETIIEEKENITPGNTKPKFPKPARKTPARPALKTITPGEIADSDEETIGDDNENGDVESEGITNQAAIVEPQNAPTDPQNDDIPSTDDPEPAETCYGAIGDETQAILNTSADELCLDLSTSDSRPSSVSREGTPTPRQNEKRREVSRAAEVISSPNTVVGKSPSPSPQEDPSDANVHTQVYTQGLESQRLPLEVIRNLGPQTPHSDILMSLHPEPLEQILSQTKTHEFRSWKIPPSVRRVWIYATKPIQELKYTVILGDAKRPGEIPDEGGIGNVEFNQGNGADYAYEIVQVYELNNPVSLVEMKQKGWCKSAPQKFAWLPPAVVGELTGNLKCALFGDGIEPTESQEIVAQFQSDVEYSTQHISSEVADEVILSSQSPRRSTRKTTQSGPSSSFAKPALPSQLQHESSTQSLRRTRSYVRPSQATTVSSPAVSPQKSLRNTVSISSDPVASNSSPPAFRNSRDNSLRSSQFLTRSQMLPDSLINDPIQPPPAIIWDSADEMSD
ncbi:hypothetical protein F4821DRAFT_233337 [Hypoxylon rubiginosum]|uniref:Uncharacterized protein n=1 Tax=Hypoxylon rubiginosum TaxID=110542 RepID=A0ACC0D7V5_9PEZI|nr:hypothetical protein F4821DRAFT_233337 [Hypoxylon rubiginosum]